MDVLGFFFFLTDLFGVNRNIPKQPLKILSLTVRAPTATVEINGGKREEMEDKSTQNIKIPAGIQRARLNKLIIPLHS